MNIDVLITYTNSIKGSMGKRDEPAANVKSCAGRRIIMLFIRLRLNTPSRRGA